MGYIDSGLTMAFVSNLVLCILIVASRANYLEEHKGKVPVLSDDEKQRLEQILVSQDEGYCDITIEDEFYAEVKKVNDSIRFGTLVDNPAYKKKALICNRFIGLRCDHIYDKATGLVNHCMCKDGLVWEPSRSTCSIDKYRPCSFLGSPYIYEGRLQLDVPSKFRNLANYNAYLKCQEFTYCQETGICLCQKLETCPKSQGQRESQHKIMESTMKKWSLDLSMMKRFAEYGEVCDETANNFYRSHPIPNEIYDWELVSQYFESPLPQTISTTCNLLNNQFCLEGTCGCKEGHLFIDEVCVITKGLTCSLNFWHREKIYMLQAPCFQDEGLHCKEALQYPRNIYILINVTIYYNFAFPIKV